VPAKWLLRQCERMGLSPLHEWIYESAATDSWVATERIEQALGFVPIDSNREALLRSYEWFVAHREEFVAFRNAFFDGVDRCNVTLTRCPLPRLCSVSRAAESVFRLLCAAPV
jgi:hypothetical protein